VRSWSRRRRKDKEREKATLFPPNPFAAAEIKRGETGELIERRRKKITK